MTTISPIMAMPVRAIETSTATIDFSFIVFPLSNYPRDKAKYMPIFYGRVKLP